MMQTETCFSVGDAIWPKTETEGLAHSQSLIASCIA